MVWLRIVYAAIVVALASLLLMPFQLLALYFDWKLRRTLPRFWHRIACHALGIRVHVHGSLERRRPLMLCANHASWMDIMVMSSVADVAFIAKSEVRSWPIFGQLARLQKSVFIVREEKRSTGNQANEIAGRCPAGGRRGGNPDGRGADEGRALRPRLAADAGGDA